MDLKPSVLFRNLSALALSVLALYTLHAVSRELLVADLLDLGRSLNAPTPGFGRFLAFWMFFGSLAACFLTWSLYRFLPSALERRVVASWANSSDRKWLIYGSLFALLIPAVLRTWLLDGMVLTDDESAYRFMAELLAAGRLFGDSPPMKLFFDNRFFINDGKMYAHYFVGWPALLAPGIWLGIPGYMNAIYSALTAPAFFLILRRLVGSSWAKAGMLLYLSSPMLMIAAATETAHTSCVAALAWFTWMLLRSNDPDSPWWSHSGAALFFCVAFFNRPTSALGVGLPLLIAWLVSLRTSSHKIRSLLAFAMPAIVLAALFLTVNKVQTGSFFEVAYQRAYGYAQENDFRFSLWPKEEEGGAFTELGFSSIRRSAAIAGAAILRLNATLFGWPMSLLFIFFAGQSHFKNLMRGSIFCYLLLHLTTNNVGIDTFAPMHYFEVALPILLLTVLGIENLTRRAASLTQNVATTSRWHLLPGTLALCLGLVSLVGYLPHRLLAVHRVAEQVAMPYEVLQQAEIHRAVIFAPDPFLFYCKNPPTRGWVFSRPNNDPWLRNDILWANHLSIESNKKLMQHFPDRRGYVMAWDLSCRVGFLPLENLAPDALPDAQISGIDLLLDSTPADSTPTPPTRVP